jgi:uncharacterized protein
VQRREPAAGVMEWIAQQDAKRAPDAPCSCGNGRPFAECHGAQQQPTSR